MKPFSFLLAFLLPGAYLSAQQARFVSSGTIEFEKTANDYALVNNGQYLGKNLAGSEQQLPEQYQKEHPQFIVSKSTLYFRDNKTLFVPDLLPATAMSMFSVPIAAQNNIVYSNFPADSLVVQKDVLGETFLLNDRARKTNWKITGETREIAGYTCRRANALIMDSIYAVAFYTEQIHIPGGPESFSGLPGMILELALPHEHVTWRAVRVMDRALPPVPVTAPKKGKPIDRRQLLDILSEAGKGRSQQGASLIRKVNLL
ncbi:MAG TPA: GLPGLI family protein [Chitinophagaceae bacterium]|jgi:GLPGLI family protein